MRQIAGWGIVAWAFVGPCLAAVDRKPVIAVKTFENPSTEDVSTIGSGLTDIFITELQRTQEFRIIERAAVSELVDEVDFGQSGYVDGRTAVQKGNISGIELWFFGKVTNFGVEQKRMGGAGGAFIPIIGGLGIHKKRTTVRIDFRVVDAATGETLLADFGEGEVKKGGVGAVGFGPGFGGLGGVSNSEFLGSAMGHASLQAIGQIVAKMSAAFGDGASFAEGRRADAMAGLVGTVLAIAGNDIVLDVGSASGIVAGTPLDLYRVTPVRDSKGEVVYSSETLVGRITVREVQGARSLASLPAGVAAAEGDIVRSRAAVSAEPLSVQLQEAAAQVPSQAVPQTKKKGVRR